MSAKLPPAHDPNALYVVDFSGYVFRAYHAIPQLTNSKGMPTNAIYGVTAMMQKLVDVQKPALLAVALDSKTKSFRHEMYAEYKATRPPTPPDLKKQVERLREVIEAYAIPVFQQDGVEADDLIASVTKKARRMGLSVVIVSADKDLLQLVGDGVVMFDSMRDKVFGVDETREKMLVAPNQVRDLLALMGDSSDNVPGVPSVGPKTAAQLLNDYGTLEGVYANIDAIKKKGLHDKLVAHKEDALLSQRLVTLRDDMEVEIDVSKLEYGGADRARLRALFTEFEFNRLLAQLGDDVPKAKPVPKAAPRSADTQPSNLRDALSDAGHFAMVPEVDARDGGLVGLAFAWGDGNAEYVPLGHLYLGAPKQADRKEFLESLRDVFENGEIRKDVADAKRDENILEQCGIALRGTEFDSMLASYLLDPELGNHTLSEVLLGEVGVEVEAYDVLTEKQRGSQKALSEVTVERLRTHAETAAAGLLRAAVNMRTRLESEGLAKLLTDMELPLAHVLAKMERTGVLLDVAHMSALSRQVTEELATIEKKVREIIGRDINLGSPKQLEAVLFDELNLRVVKRTKTGRSTDHEVLEELAAEHPLPEAILEHRALSKLKSTYLETLPKAVDKNGRIHTRYNQAVAATGRLSSSDPNLQNIPIRSEIGRSIRDAFVAEPGWQMMSSDYSQIELRVLAHLSHDPELVEAFTTGEDVHVRTARALFGVPTEGVTKEMRGRAKTVNFAVIYGQTEFALARNLRIDRKEAAHYISAFFERYSGVKRFLDQIIEDARNSGSVRTLLGRKRVINDLTSSNRGLRMAAERMARNAPIQGTSADIIKMAMINIDRELTAEDLRARMLLTVHDELVFEVPAAERDLVGPLVKAAMENVIKLDVPLVVEQGWGPSWGKAH